MITMPHQAPQDLMRTAQGFIQRHDYKNALSMFYQCIGQFPDFIPAYLYLSNYFLNQQQIPIAMQVLSKALEQVPGNPEACQMLAPLLASLVPQGYHPVLEKDLQHCYEDPQINHQLLARPAAQLLLHKYSLFAEDEVADWNLLTWKFSEDQLWKSFLSQSMNTYPAMEARLTELRAWLLHKYSETHFIPASHIPLASALALQMFANEYVLAVSDEELLQCEKLHAYLAQPLTEEGLTSISLLLALYQPLFSIQNLPIELLQQRATTEPLLNLLLQRSYLDLETEQTLIPGISRIDAPVDSVSTKVRAQYEQNPYPRWQAPPTPKPGKLISIIQSLPGFDATHFNPSTPVQVLVAGCGTGYEPIDLARMDNSINITAVDLSNASLAYAKRMATTLGVAAQIQFHQGNILAIEELGKTFDVVNSTGVLHHMENPEGAWEKLCSITKPGGMMRISLYSERARSRIAAAHRLIKEQGLESTTPHIKNFRQQILAMDIQSTLGELACSDDFYSTSGCRDLLFHAHEQRFTLPQIKNLLSRLGLTLAGFDVTPKTAQLFKQQFGEKANLLDLHLWDQFEQKHPDTFAGMYQLWCQRI